MEVVGGAVGVVALSLQLASTVRKCRAMLRSIKGAPDELLRLSDSLKRLNGLLENVGGLLNRMESLECSSESTSILEDAVSSCQVTITSLENIVKRIECSSQHQSKRFWLAVRLLVRLEIIEDTQRRVQEDMAILQTALTLNQSHL